MTRRIHAMTVDVEEHFQVSAFEGYVPREDWENQPSRVEDNTRRLLDLFDDADVHGTFFVLGWVAERLPGLVPEIASRGHEIACHGYSHRLIYEQQPAEFREELRRAKSILEQQSGQSVVGHRAASFSIGMSNLWALDELVDAGFEYDSSLFPVRHDRYGVPGAPREPYRLATPNGGSLIEVPPSTVDVGPWTLPVAGGGYLRLYPHAVTDWAIRRIDRKRRGAVVYVHPWEVDPEQPRVSGLPTIRRFRHYVNIDTTARKLQRLTSSHAFGTMRDLISMSGPLSTVSLH